MQGDKDNAVSVPFTDDNDKPANDTTLAELLEEDSPTATPEERRSRAEKKAERTRRLIEEGKQHAARDKQLEGEQGTLRSELDRLKGYVAAQSQQRPVNDGGKDPYEAELDSLYKEQSDAYQAAQAEIKAGNWTPERMQHYEHIARGIESRKMTVHMRKAMESQTAQMRTEQAQQVWVQKYPEVYQNQQAFNYARATFHQRQALGEAVNNQLVDEVMQETINKFRLGGKPAPSASEKARMTGIPSSGSSGAGARSGELQMTPALTRMALAAYDGVSEDEAVKRWKAGPGKRLREKKVI